MKKGFFARLKSIAQYDAGGRYVALVLKEVMLEDSRVARILFGDKCRLDPCEHDVTCEWSFSTRQGGRRADLAVLDRSSGDPIALLEVKYRDERTPHSSAQLSDYVQYAKIHRIPFTYVTQVMPPKKDSDLISRARCKHLLYSDLCKLAFAFTDESPAITMLCEYLREEGFVFQRGIDKDVLTLLMLRSMNFHLNTGLGRLNTRARMLEAVPELFSRLLGNAAAIGDHFYDRHGRDYMSQRPTVNYYFEPWIDGEKFASMKDKNTHMAVPKHLIHSGRMWCYAECNLSRLLPGVQVQLGYLFDLDIEYDPPVDMCTFAWVWAFGACDLEYSAHDPSADENRTMTRILGQLRSTIGRVIKKARKATKRQVSRLVQFQRTLTSR